MANLAGRTDCWLVEHGRDETDGVEYLNSNQALLAKSDASEDYINKQAHAHSLNEFSTVLARSR